LSLSELFPGPATPGWQPESIYSPSTVSSLSDCPPLFSAGGDAASVAPSEESQATVVPDERILGSPRVVVLARILAIRFDRSQAEVTNV
jgi:hypothetical protein